VTEATRFFVAIVKLKLPKTIAEQKTKELPLVECTNALNVHDFTTRYIDPARLHIQISPKHNNSTDDEIHAEIHIYSAATIPSLDFESCFSLIETTSSADYESSSMGWSPSKKRKEMRLPDMRYVVLRGRLPLKKSDDSNNNVDGETSPRSANNTTSKNNDNNTPITAPHSEVLGFLSFMTTYEDGKEVLYCYEIHIHPELQGHGVGRQLMSLFEETARRIGLEKAMLTVFKANTAALAFYERLGYGVDEFSPEPRRFRNGTVKEPDYLILSKAMIEGP
jgi:N-alpha-acetyltransferase 40